MEHLENILPWLLPKKLSTKIAAAKINRTILIVSLGQADFFQSVFCLARLQPQLVRISATIDSASCVFIWCIIYVCVCPFYEGTEENVLRLNAWEVYSSTGKSLTFPHKITLLIGDRPY